MLELNQDFLDRMLFKSQREARRYHTEHHAECKFSRRQLIRAYEEWRAEGGLEDIIAENVKYKQQTQRYADTNRIERKSFREQARISNALEDYNTQLITLLESIDVSTVFHEKTTDTSSVGIIQLSDLHMNELINIQGNRYDFTIASKRLKLLADRAIKYFTVNGIGEVVIAITGDCLNSDRRLDELLNQSTNRAKATIIAFHLLEQFIVHLNQYFNVSVISVSGNESRAKDEMGYTEILASDNYDYTLFNMLRIAFRGKEGITYVECRAMEDVFCVAGHNILLMHGLAVKHDIEKSIQQTMGRYSADGIKIDYVFVGHIHSARIGDLYARSSSLCGANGYSNYALNLASRASQNIAIFYNDGGHDVMKIDLQNVDHLEGYPIHNEIEAYNARSAEKLHEKKVIFQIII